MTVSEREIKRKLRVLNYAKETGNISKAYRFFGLSRQSFLANNGIRREVIAEILRHHDIRSTKIYTHFRPQTIKNAVAVFDRVEPPENDQKVSANLEF